ncbi:MAG: cupin domain-containing protein [Deltaproteobacteria bacterium]|nr:cupin domain-containing protein [Deltaproteobacteria bacterium]
MTVLKNLFADIPQELPGELSEELVSGKMCRIERIISRSHASPEGFWYDQDDDEWVVLLQGSAGLCLAEGNKTVVLKPGDYIRLPAHCRHRVEWTDPTQDTVWLVVYYL